MRGACSLACRCRHLGLKGKSSKQLLISIPGASSGSMRFCSDIEPQGTFSAALAALTAASTSFAGFGDRTDHLVVDRVAVLYHLSVATYSPSMKLRILSAIMISPVTFSNVAGLCCRFTGVVASSGGRRRGWGRGCVWRMPARCTPEHADKSNTTVRKRSLSLRSW